MSLEVTLKVAVMGEVVVSYEAAAPELQPLPESITRELDQIDAANPSVKPASPPNFFKKLFSSVGHKL